MGKATPNMLEFAQRIANELDLDLPTKQNEDGETVTDNSFDAISEFIVVNKDEYYLWRN